MTQGLGKAYIDIAEKLISQCKALGADEVDVVCGRAIAISFEQRLGKPDEAERSEASELGLRVIIGKSQAIVSSSDFSDDALNALAERAIAMAKVVPEDPYCGLATPEQLGKRHDKDLQSADPTEPSTDDLMKRAALAEEAALAIKGISNSEGSGASWEKTESMIIGSNGLQIHETSTEHSIGLSVIAGQGENMQSAYDYAISTFAEDLETPESLGISAAEQALAKMNPDKIPSGEVAVLFDPKASSSLIGALASAINGLSIARGTSFLKDSLEQEIMPKDINIIDDPHIVRGFASSAIDAEGLTNGKCYLVENGRLMRWLLNLSSAKQLGLAPNGHAGRGIASSPYPSISNLYVENGKTSRNDLISSIKQGLLVTDLMGMGINGVTGDYSQGAAGFRIENGKVTSPVSEVTIASNLKDMYKNMVAANDLKFRRRINAPTLLVPKMTVAGL